MSEALLNLTFLAFAGLTALSALLVFLLRNLLHAAVALFFCLTGVAVLYIFLGADFLGAAQLVIYAGGVLVLIIFGIFLTAKIYPARPEFSQRRLHWIFGGLIGAAVFALSVMVITGTDWPLKKAVYSPTTHELGRLFLTKYLLPFELISILLLFVMIGAVILVRKEMGDKEW